MDAAPEPSSLGGALGLLTLALVGEERVRGVRVGDALLPAGCDVGAAHLLRAKGLCAEWNVSLASSFVWTLLSLQGR